MTSQLPLPIPKPYVDHQREMAAKVKYIESMREKKKRDAASTQAIIDKALDDLNALADVVLEGQSSLPFDEASPTASLAAIAMMAQCTPLEALTCPTHGTCTCLQPEQPVLRLKCTGVDGTVKGHEIEEACCIGVEEGAETPGCNLCCEHAGGICRPVTEADQPKPVVPTTAPEVKAGDCPLHGVESKHGPALVTAPPDWWRCERCGEEFGEDRSSHAIHADGCDGSCKRCPVECGPISKVNRGTVTGPPAVTTVPEEPPRAGGLKAGDRVLIHGFRCEVLRTGDPCEEEGCERPTVTIVDPEGAVDTVHLSECEGLDVPVHTEVAEVPLDDEKTQ